MAEAKLKYPFAGLSGALSKKDKIYCRMAWGKCILQHKPRKTTAKQRAMRAAFGAKYAGRHKKSNS